MKLEIQNRVELTDRQKTIEVQRAVKKYLKNTLEPKMMKYIQEELHSDGYADSLYCVGDKNFLKKTLEKFIKNDK